MDLNLNKILKEVYSSFLFWLLLGLSMITWMAGMFFESSASTSEKWYHNTVYVLFRKNWDQIFSYLPFPLLYLWLFGLFICISVFLYKLFKRKYQTSRIFILLFAFISIHLIWFYWSWAFNYHRTSLSGRWHLDQPIDENIFLNVIWEQYLKVNSIRKQYKFEIENYAYDADKLEVQIRNLVNSFQRSHNFNEFENVRCRILKPSGSLMIWSASGIYLPFVGEGQLDNGLHVLSKPFTMAHEFSHGMGWTHEGDCNFIAYRACKMSPDPIIRYSAELNYFRYLLSNAIRNHPDHFKDIKNCIDPDVITDLQKINEANNRYPELFPIMRDWFYNWYLKKHGIATGDKSYSEVVRMVINYEKINH